MFFLFCSTQTSDPVINSEDDEKLMLKQGTTLADNNVGRLMFIWTKLSSYSGTPLTQTLLTQKAPDNTK